LFATRTRAQWAAFAAEHECCVEPVAELDEALASPPLRDAVLELPAPGGGGARVRALAPPVRLTRTPADPARRPAPRLGEHADEVLAEAGLTAGAIAALHARGAVAGPAHERAASFLS